MDLNGDLKDKKEPNEGGEAERIGQRTDTGYLNSCQINVLELRKQGNMVSKGQITERSLDFTLNIRGMH